MNYLVISSHPEEDSFNADAARVVKETATLKGHTVRQIDLVREGFDPVMKAEDLRLWSKNQFVDPFVGKYQQEIEAADILVFPFPIWWGSMPAILKGFCDKVLLPGWAYQYTEEGDMIGLLSDKKALVITTMETPLDFYNAYFKNPVEGGFIKDTLQACGIEVLRYLAIDQIVSGSKEHTNSKMNEIQGLIV